MYGQGRSWGCAESHVSVVEMLDFGGDRKETSMTEGISIWQEYHRDSEDESAEELSSGRQAEVLRRRGIKWLVQR